jgi:hypothetical protein
MILPITLQHDSPCPHFIWKEEQVLPGGNSGCSVVRVPRRKNRSVGLAWHKHGRTRGDPREVEGVLQANGRVCVRQIFKGRC